jgi:uncharacterized Tic20 family protein
VTRSERAAIAAHLSPLAVALLVCAAAGRPVIWAGMVAFAGPLVVWAAARRSGDPFVRAHTAAALAFNLSLALYLGGIVGGMHVSAGSPYGVQFVPFFLFVNMLLAFNWLAFSAVGAVRAARGELFTYPLALRRLGGRA